MKFTYTYKLTDFPNGKVSLDRLSDEIKISEIVIVLSYINMDTDFVYIFFKDQLSDNNKLILDNIISEHSGEPYPPSIPIVKAEILTETSDYVLKGETLHGYFAAESLILDIEHDILEKILDVSWGFDISLQSGSIIVSDKMVNDEMIVEISPNTLIGALISDLNSGDTIIYVSPTVIENLKIGFYFGLYSTGGTFNELGRVVEIGKDYVKINKPSTFSAPAGTYVAMCIRVIPYLYFNYMGEISIGKSIPTGVRIPKGTILRFKYYNKSISTSKKVSFFIEYLY